MIKKHQPIRAGLIGANAKRGWSAGTHLPALATLPGYVLSAVCTTRIESVRETAAQYGVEHVLTDPAALVSLPDLDLVVVSVRAPKHAALVRMAIEAGKNVLCEWPLGVSLEESRELHEYAMRNGVKGFVSLQGHAAAPVQFARDLIAQGRIGPLLSINLTAAHAPWGATTTPGAAYLADERNGATVVTILGGHSLDILCALSGEFESVYGIIMNRRGEVLNSDTGERTPKTSPDQLLLTGVLKSGVPVSAHIQGGAPTPDEFILDIRGEAGALRLTSSTIPEILPPQLFANTTPGGALEPIDTPASYFTAPALGGGPAVNIAQLYNIIADDLHTGTSRTPDFAHAVRLKGLIAAIEKSSQSGRRQQL